jgi:excisionase family DNA binding protein
MMSKQTNEDDAFSSPGSPQENDTSELSSPLWTVDDVADYLQLQPETIRSMARRGELPAIKLGKVWRFRKTAIHEMLVNRR